MSSMPCRAMFWHKVNGWAATVGESCEGSLLGRHTTMLFRRNWSEPLKWHTKLGTVSGNDPKTRKRDSGKLKAARRICFSGRTRRRGNAKERAQRGADRLRLAASRRGSEGQRSLPGDGSIAAGVLPLEAAVRRTGIERAARTSATAGREPQAKRDRRGPHVGQAHLAGSALKKGLKPAKRRELVREVRQSVPVERTACTSAGFSIRADPVRLSKTDGAAAARRLARKYQACVPSLSRGRAAGANEEAKQKSGPSAHNASRS